MESPALDARAYGASRCECESRSRVGAGAIIIIIIIITHSVSRLFED